jgi:hypothetical protein
VVSSRKYTTYELGYYSKNPPCKPYLIMSVICFCGKAVDFSLTLAQHHVSARDYGSFASGKTFLYKLVLVCSNIIYFYLIILNRADWN